MKLIILLLISTIGFSQKKETPKQDSIKLTNQTKFISVMDLYVKADQYKDSVSARQYDNFIYILNGIVEKLITEQKRKQ